MHDLTGFQRDCLYVIAGLDAPNGLIIKDELKDYYTTDIQHGQVYTNLNTLIENRLVEKRSIIKTAKALCELLTNIELERQILDLQHGKVQPFQLTRQPFIGA